MSSRPPSPSGPIPDWLDVDTAGWPIRNALVTLTQDLLHAAMREGEPSLLDDGKGNKRLEPGYIMPNGRTPLLMPEGVPPWWKASEVHIPALLSKMISGRLVAFGDPDTTGAHPRWIARRQWQQLKFDPVNVAEPVAGAGAVFWNVRVMDVDEYHGLAAAMEPGATRSVSPPALKTEPRLGAGGRPKHNAYEAFIAELIRLADTPDGLPESRRELKAHMLDWLGQRFADDQPTDSTVDSWLSKLVPGKR